MAEKVAPKNADVLLTASRLVLAMREYTLAETKADEVLQVDAKQMDAMLIKSQVLIAQGDRAGALSALDKAIETDPALAAARLDRANQLILSGEDAKAKADVTAVLEAQPRNAAATYLNGLLLVRAGRFADAQGELQKLAPVVARFPRALYFEAVAAANLGQTESAIELGNRYIARAPADPDGVRLVARAELKAQRPERAAAVLKRAVAAGQEDGQTLDLLGRAYALMGQTPQAVETFKQANAASPQDPQILTHLASSQMQAGNPGQAAAALEKSIDIAPAQNNTGEALVAAALAAGDLNRAEEALTRLRGQVGETEAVGNLTGMLALSRMNLEAGRAAFAETVRRFPDSASAKLNLAKVLILQQQRPEAETLLRELLAKDPANPEAINTSVQLAFQEQRYADAIKTLEAARTAAPKNPAFTAMLADAMVRSGDPRRAVAMLQEQRNKEELPLLLLDTLARSQAAAGLTTEAKATYNDILKANPGNLEIRRGQVELLLRNKENDAAMASLREALANAPGNQGVMSAMTTLAGRSSGPDAALALAQQLRDNPANLPGSTVLKGDALMAAARPAEAAEAYRAEYSATPTTGLLLRLAGALSANGKKDDAAALLREGLAKSPEEPEIAQMLGLMDVAAGRWKEAEKNLSLVLAKRPSDPVAMNNLAWVYQQVGDDRARNLAQRAYLQAPSSETADTLGWIMVKQGDSAEAVPLLQQSSNQRPTEPTIRYHLAVALSQTGRKDDAVKILQALVTGEQAFDDKAEARKLLENLSPIPAPVPRR